VQVSVTATKDLLGKCLPKVYQDFASYGSARARSYLSLKFSVTNIRSGYSLLIILVSSYERESQVRLETFKYFCPTLQTNFCLCIPKKDIAKLQLNISKTEL
jgi:hypothetical protein